MSTNFVGEVLVNGELKEYFGELNIQNGRLESLETKSFADTVVRHFKLTTPRKNPMQVVVKLSTLEIKGGKMERKFYGNIPVMPYLKAMTVDEFNAEQAEILKECPEEFRGVFSGKAWEDGHSAGYEEVISHLSELVDAFKEPINKFANRLGRNG